MGMPHLAENLEAGLEALGVDVSRARKRIFSDPLAIPRLRNLHLQVLLDVRLICHMPDRRRP